MGYIQICGAALCNSPPIPWTLMSNHCCPNAEPYCCCCTCTDLDGTASTVRAGAFTLSPNRGTIRCASSAGAACQVLTYTPAAGAFPTAGVTVALTLTDASGIAATGQRFRIGGLRRGGAGGWGRGTGGGRKGRASATQQPFKGSRV